MNISGLPFYSEVSTLRAEGSPIKFPIFGFVSLPLTSEARRTSLLGLVITLKAGVVLEMCLFVWVSPSLNFDL